MQYCNVQQKQQRQVPHMTLPSQDYSNRQQGNTLVLAVRTHAPR